MSAQSPRSHAGIFKDRNFGKDIEYALPGTPCMKVAEGRICHVPDRLAEEFPEDKGMIDMGTVSYLGVPLRVRAEKSSVIWSRSTTSRCQTIHWRCPYWKLSRRVRRLNWSANARSRI